MTTRQGVWTTGIFLVGLFTVGCKSEPDLSTTSASPDEYVLSVPGMH